MYEDAIASLEAVASAGKNFRREYTEQVLVVEGSGQFPFAMLSRDACAPRSEEDAARMALVLCAPLRQVMLRRFIRSGETAPALERWRSFGWDVLWYGHPLDFLARRTELTQTAT